MICAECKKANTTSKVRVNDKIAPEEMKESDHFFDEVGQWHAHMPDQTLNWICSNGHTFSTVRTFPCGPCKHMPQHQKPQPGVVPAQQKAGTPVK